MKTKKDEVVISINHNMEISPEMAYQIREVIVSKFDVDAIVIPNPTISNPVEVTSKTLDSDTINLIAEESMSTLMPLLESRK